MLQLSGHLDAEQALAVPMSGCCGELRWLRLRHEVHLAGGAHDHGVCVARSAGQGGTLAGGHHVGHVGGAVADEAHCPAEAVVLAAHLHVSSVVGALHMQLQ